MSDEPWIGVSVELPPVGETVWTKGTNLDGNYEECSMIRYYDPDAKLSHWCISDHRTYIRHTPTHWRRLPDA